MSGVRGFLRRRSAENPVGPQEHVDPARAERDPDEPLRIAAITFCRDEGRMLPLWVTYYGDQFGVENLYVVDDNSEDGSTDHLPCDVLHIPPIRGGAFNSTRMAMVGNLGRSLLQLYDVVLFCDTDEFSVPDPDRHAGLRQYVEARSQEGLNAVGSLGFNVVHNVGDEPPLDLTRPLLGQRQLAKFLPLMCKPAIKWVPAHWSAGTHGVRTPYRVDPDLWMFHMKFGDRDHLQEAADHRQRMVEADGRSRDTQWRQGGDTLVDLLERITEGADATRIPAFVPPTGEKLAALVVEDPPGNWRAPKGSQMTLMEKRPLVRIPERFHGIV
jgi:hypothetical protein